jgi:hypothetical protein
VALHAVVAEQGQAAPRGFFVGLRHRRAARRHRAVHRDVQHPVHRPGVLVDGGHIVNAETHHRRAAAGGGESDEEREQDRAHG